MSLKIFTIIAINSLNPSSDAPAHSATVFIDKAPMGQIKRFLGKPFN